MSIFNKITANSKAVVEKTKAHSAIKNLENEKKDLLTKLGQAAFNAYATTGKNPVEGDEAANLVAEITKRLQLIGEQRDHIAKVDEETELANHGIKASGAGEAVCPCGHKNAAGANFCIGCGGKL